MTESQTLLAEYAEAGSEAAFCELVGRYFGLVYSTALRLVDGDTHLAEDVAQTVFMDLAHNARRLTRETMLGGWLHQRAFYIASPMMRAQRRRRAREREAAHMSTLLNDSDSDMAEISPILDEAITHLEVEDRTAIVLRFFEQRDFRSIGKTLGSSEDAARMRVTRALDKLHLLLKQRGATLSAAALGTVLAGQAVTAAPAGLAMSVAGSVLAGSAGGGLSATLLKVGTMTKLKTGIMSAIVMSGVVTSLMIHNQGHARLGEQDKLLRERSDQLAQFAADNERLARLAGETNHSRDELAELLRLRGAAESLRRQTNELARLRERNLQLQQGLKAGPQTPLQLKEETLAKVEFEKNWLLAFRMYAMDHKGQFPTNFEQATPLLSREFKTENTVSPDQFEIVYQGDPTNWDFIALREKQPWPNSEGKLVKIYGMVDGSVQTLALPIRWTSNGREVHYDSFDAFEKDHMLAPSEK